MRRPTRVIELTAGGPNDPDGSKTAIILAAYFHAEHARAFRRLVWPLLAGLVLIWTLISTAVSLSGSRMILGLIVLAAGGAWAVIAEWRAGSKLKQLAGQTDDYEKILSDK
jgi:hypothetical protein